MCAYTSQKYQNNSPTLPPWPRPTQRTPPQHIPTVTPPPSQTCNLTIAPSGNTDPYYADLLPHQYANTVMNPTTGMEARKSDLLAGRVEGQDWPTWSEATCIYLLVRVFFLYLLSGCMIPNTLMWYLYNSWFQEPNIHLLFFLISLSWISFLVGMSPMIRYLKFLKRLTCVGLVMKSPIMSFLGNHSKFNSFLLIRSVMKNKLMLMFLVHFLLYYFTFFFSIMGLLLPGLKKFHELLSLDFHKIPCPAYIRNAVVDSNNLWFSWAAGV